MAAPMAALTAATDLGFGLGDMLRGQQMDQVDEEERKRRLGLSGGGMDPMNFGMTGVASADLGFASARR